MSALVWKIPVITVSGDFKNPFKLRVPFSSSTKTKVKKENNVLKTDNSYKFSQMEI